MKKRLLFLLALMAAIVAVMAVARVLFVLIQPAYTTSDLSFLPQMLWHGLPMDLSVAGYLCAPVALWLIFSVWYAGGLMFRLLRAWLIVVSVVIAVGVVADSALYPFWGFRLDSTPLFYVLSSPTAAVASVSGWYVVGGVVAAVVLGALVWLFVKIPLRIVANIAPCSRRRVVATAVMVVAAAALIIPIRGGVTVSTMSPGRAYFSNEMRLNHAAQNPLFTFLHSLAHANNLAQQFNTIDSQRCKTLFAEFVAPLPSDTSSAAAMPRLRTQRPDVWLIIAEGFSAHLLPSTGGENIATGLDSIASSAILFDNFYAESFRTDRAVATILAGYPALPTTSVMRFTNKFANMPSLARELKNVGYSTQYYYGGDIDFTNLNAFLIAQGFDHIVSDKDFPLGQRLGKWGAHDGVVIRRALDDFDKGSETLRPVFRVVQTSSSHEPFDVPMHRHKNPRINAFMYADSCITALVNGVRRSPQWNNTLVVIVPDHWGAYPQNLTDHKARHHVPLILTGGALENVPQRISVPASQSVIAPSLLHMLGLSYDSFTPLSHSVFDANARQYAWLTEPEWFMAVDATDEPSLNVDDKSGGKSTEHIRAFIQTLYNDLDSR